MVKIIDGQVLAEKIKDDIVKETVKIKGRRPNLAIILIGNRSDSVLYVNLKEKEAKKVGIDTHIYKCAAETDEREIFDMINFLNNDDSIDAILVQLPLPENFDTDGIILAINPAKDVDGFHPGNMEKFFNSCDHNNFVPPVYGVVLEILRSINYKPEHKQACIIANSEIFSRGLAWSLKCLGCNVEITNTDDFKLKEKSANADILISAVGQAQFIKKYLVKKDAVIIDIGISQKDGKICGDVDFKDVKDIAGYITPVPGGVGPMTIALALKNTLNLYQKSLKK